MLARTLTRCSGPSVSQNAKWRSETGVNQTAEWRTGLGVGWNVNWRSGAGIGWAINRKPGATDPQTANGESGQKLAQPLTEGGFKSPDSGTELMLVNSGKDETSTTNLAGTHGMWAWTPDAGRGETSARTQNSGTDEMLAEVANYGINITETYPILDTFQ